MSKQRADIILVQQGFYPEVRLAERAIMAGIVYNLETQERIETPGQQLKSDEIIFQIKGKKHPYVGRGGLKLESAIDYFNINLQDKVVLDIGASTGGFTDCALKNGAQFLYALDVGTNQLAWKLRSDERVLVMEQLNFRHTTIDMFENPQVDFIVTDVSFISLKVILDQVEILFSSQPIQMVALIKPQFEIHRDDVTDKGIVSSPELREKVCDDIEAYIRSKGWKIHGIIPSPITGTKGNIEYLIYFSL